MYVLDILRTALTEFDKMFMEFIISLHTWAMARPAFENEQASESFEAQISVLVAKEREQGRSSSSSPLVLVARPSLLGTLLPPLEDLASILLRLPTFPHSLDFYSILLTADHHGFSF